VKKWEGVVLSKIEVLQAHADAEKIQVQVGNQTQELGAAQAKYLAAFEAHKASGVNAKSLKESVHAYVAEKEFADELVSEYIQVIPPTFRLY
jgi:hypothetical protein